MLRDNTIGISDHSPNAFVTEDLQVIHEANSPNLKIANKEDMWSELIVFKSLTAFLVF